MSRAVVVPSVLVPSHELQADGPPGDLRHDRRRLRGIVLTAVAVDARAFLVPHLNLFGRQAEHAGQARASAVNILGRGDDQCGIGFHVGNRAVRAEGRVSVIGSASDLGDDVRRGAERGFDIALFEHHPVLGFRRSHLLVHAVVAGQHGFHVPRDFQLPGGANRIPFVLRHDADEIGAAHDTSTWNAANGTFIEARYRRACAIGTLAAGPHDAAVQHARHAHVLHVGECSTDLGGDVVAGDGRANQPVLIGRLDRRRAGHLQVEWLVADERAVFDRTGRVAHDGDHTLRHRQAIGRRLQRLRCQLKQRLPRKGGGGADLW